LQEVEQALIHLIRIFCGDPVASSWNDHHCHHTHADREQRPETLQPPGGRLRCEADSRLSRL